MSNKFAWASIDENGKISGGKAGDQTGKEVKIGDYYDFGQTQCIRFKNVVKAKKAGKIAKTLAIDNSIGYSQSDRFGLWNICVSNNWKWAKIKKKIANGTLKKANTDCSQFATCVINLAYGKELIPKETATSNICTQVSRYPKKFGIISVAAARKKWRKGDMPVKAGKHIIINV